MFLVWIKTILHFTIWIKKNKIPKLLVCLVNIPINLISSDGSLDRTFADGMLSTVCYSAWAALLFWRPLAAIAILWPADTSYVSIDVADWSRYCSDFRVYWYRILYNHVSIIAKRIEIEITVFVIHRIDNNRLTWLM